MISEGSGSTVNVPEFEQVFSEGFDPAWAVEKSSFLAAIGIFSAVLAIIGRRGWLRYHIRNNKEHVETRAWSFHASENG